MKEGYVFFCDYEKIKSIEKEIYNYFKNNLSGVYTISDSASSSFLFPQVSHECINELDALQICVDGGLSDLYLADGIANGLWALDSLTLRRIECFGEVNISNLPLKPVSKSSIESVILSLINSKKIGVINSDDLWILRDDVNKIYSSDGNFDNLGDYIDNSQEYKKIITTDLIHPTAERHALNREQIFKAALRFREEQPNVFEQVCRKNDGSINFSAFARELMDRPSYFINHEIPIKTQESIAGILSKAYKSPTK